MGTAKINDRTPRLMSVLFWDLNNWKQEKKTLQTWIFQLTARCVSQSKADMETQTIVGYIKQGYL